MNQIDIQYLETPWGELVLGAFDGQLCLCDWRLRKRRAAVDARVQKKLSAEFVQRDNPVLEAARRELRQYFAHERKTFDVPLMLVGSAFQQRVWRALLEIPFGQTTSYLALAETIADRNSVRAVAAANGANGLSIFVPCHRVIGSNGDLVGYAGGLRTKADLLGLEFELAN